ncbi:fibroblast growth factor 1-like isoform X2 [Montipora foliosa]|uniref:fibroblast growth factor 1-like isoform X2 n=1 Tax=Montipora foliosa TaxID=591990 RepID=UPI0035F161F4
MLRTVFANGVCWTFVLIVQSIVPSESLRDGALPKGGEWAGSGHEDDDSEVEETYATSEQNIYKRLTNARVDRRTYTNRGAYLRRGRLFNRNGYVLTINTDGTVYGTTNKDSPFAQLEFHSVGTGLLMILGISSQRYLSISDTGLLRGSEDASLNSVFREVHEANMYHSYLSYKHSRWLVGIKKNGKAKRGSLTKVGQKSTQFLITYN